MQLKDVQDFSSFNAHLCLPVAPQCVLETGLDCDDSCHLIFVDYRHIPHIPYQDLALFQAPVLEKIKAR